MGKIIIISAPSGCGKSTIIKAMMERGLTPPMKFSVSATNRLPRPGEEDGVSYHFLSDEAFRGHIAGGDFVEYEEVYPGRFYGTLKSEIDGICAETNCILDIDVKGALNVKRLYGDSALALFIEPPSVEALGERLRGRATDSEAEIATRLDRARYEISFAPEFDARVVNDDLEEAIAETSERITRFLEEQ